MRYITTVNDQEFTIDINDDGHVQIDDDLLDIDFQGIPGTSLYSLIINGQSYEVAVDDNDELYQVMLKSTLYEVKVEDERTRRLAGLVGGSSTIVGEVLIKAPMPGVIVSIPVQEGQKVTKEDIVVVLESMKMQNEFKTPKDGIVSSVRVAPGDKVDQNAIMVTIS